MNEQWCHGLAQCLQCGHEWVAVWPLAAEPLECPQCGSSDTVREQQAVQRNDPRKTPNDLAKLALPEKD